MRCNGHLRHIWSTHDRHRRPTSSKDKEQKISSRTHSCSCAKVSDGANQPICKDHIKTNSPSYAYCRAGSRQSRWCSLPFTAPLETQFCPLKRGAQDLFPTNQLSRVNTWHVERIRYCHWLPTSPNYGVSPRRNLENLSSKPHIEYTRKMTRKLKPRWWG